MVPILLEYFIGRILVEYLFGRKGRKDRKIERGGTVWVSIGANIGISISISISISIFVLVLVEYLIVEY